MDRCYLCNCQCAERDLALVPVWAPDENVHMPEYWCKRCVTEQQILNDYNS